MDKDEMMEIERRKYIAAAMQGDADWSTQNDPSDILLQISNAYRRREWAEAIGILEKAIHAAADSHVRQMDDLGRFDDVDIIAELRGMREEMIDLHDSIRGCK